MLTRVLVLLAVVVAVGVAGLLWRAHERAVRHRDLVPADGRVSLADLPDGALDTAPGASATVVVVGTRGCGDCARTLAALRASLAARPEVAVGHVLAERAPELVERLHVRTAPTVLLADGAGTVVATHPGAVDPDRVLAALADLSRGRHPVLAATGQAHDARDARGARAEEEAR